MKVFNDKNPGIKHKLVSWDDVYTLLAKMMIEYIESKEFKNENL